MQLQTSKISECFEKISQQLNVLFKVCHTSKCIPITATQHHTS